MTENEKDEATLAVDELGLFAAGFNNRHKGLPRIAALISKLEAAHPRKSDCVPVLHSAREVIAAMASLLRAGGREIPRPDAEKEEAVQ